MTFILSISAGQRSYQREIELQHLPGPDSWVRIGPYRFKVREFEQSAVRTIVYIENTLQREALEGMGFEEV